MTKMIIAKNKSTLAFCILMLGITSASGVQIDIKKNNENKIVKKLNANINRSPSNEGNIHCQYDIQFSNKHMANKKTLVFKEFGSRQSLVKIGKLEVSIFLNEAYPSPIVSVFVEKFLEVPITVTGSLQKASLSIPNGTDSLLVDCGQK